MYKKQLATILIVLFLSTGCATKALTEETIGEYKDLGLGEFIKERFFSNRSAIARMANDENFIIESGDALHFPAAYNYPVFGEVGDQLMRAKRDLGNYCVANEGKFTQVYSYEENVAKISMLSGPRANADLLNTLKRESATLWHHPDYYKTVKLLEDVKMTYAFIYSHPRHRKHLDEAIEGYEIGIKDKPFGFFNCVDSRDNTEEYWAVSILPTGFKPSDPGNSLTAHSVTVSIIPVW